ncbi:Ig-like and fibronectin type-III domain-containing protein 2 isoform X1 [Parasteatoda tepidariorum]|uniref:Ig-like and fibronectin type-III domain-containing protein 2 isoform X1 n=1 Tax=Parasteatoda tepidariorum TaxID=114398 RepID=UPI001C71DA9C|nr:Ig-like and fibronectin type-III domain-containing protein 1 isoform X1 [Parasteatoda tepidariorum]XP_042905607.1 Ig-like and fibronectin type-III domain-containing protein 1 isoform X2 [Parasteatoda tepidariorum]XP_042905608.1 Ig-like and fibronectin type-III domain-containing protein 1 isoform X3 [Parasteatoda tepidariorum]XP_042905609.1 Ig-like and fibronectin type-III domain-containing protein 1 isoform X4 [Parasteatoda tepidariorum]XP_042905611.1 Ig-like and fibronectin type-III domain-
MELSTANSSYIIFSFCILLICSFSTVKGAPTLEATPLEPLLAVAGDAVLIDCVVKNLQNYTIIWRRVVPGSNKTEILSAGEVRIIPDSRFSLLHQKGHETWVLQIQKAQVNDSGRYICEVNTNPRMQIFRLLSVVERIQTSTKAFPVDHNYTNCCVNHGVPANCRDFCSLQSVIMGGHPNPWQCMDHLPVITRCLTDGRNHMPCCEKQNIPEVCRSVCSGDYGLSTVLQHYSCMDHTIPTLSCIAEGIELLPGPPQELTVEALSESELKVKWIPPHQDVPVERYHLNLTLIKELSDAQEMELGSTDQKKMSKIPELKKLGTSTSVKSFMTVIVDGNKTSYVASGLQPMSMYEVRVTSENSHGTSMPTYAVRALTLSSDSRDAVPVNTSEIYFAHLPNITKCCEDKGVPQGKCLNSLCDPSAEEDAKLSDVLMCAPYVNITFECMAGGVDHSQCCQQRGLPEICLDFCRGNITQLDYRHFICLDHIDIYGNCLLEHYKVLPGSPEQFLVSMVHSRWAVLRWSPPSVLAESVLGYVLYWKEVAMDEIIEYNVVTDVKSPHLLDDLKPQTRYEVYVAAKNAFGLSRGSVRAVFTTTPEVNKTEKIMKNTPTYNETACCIAAGLKKSCLDLCSYNMKMSDLQLLAIPCANQLEILVRCGAGGRDHTSCCQRRGIRWECQPLCSAVIEMSPQAIASTCIGDAGKIIQCMAEGVGMLPEAPQDLHTMSVLPTRIHVKWNFNNTTEYPVWFEVRYTETHEKIPPHPLDYAYIENSTDTSFDLKNLKPDSYYSIYVVAMNEFGPSLASLVLLVRTPERDEIYNETVEATLGPPHSLEVTHQTMDSVSLSWRSPFHVPANSSLTYTVFYQPVNSTEDIEDSQSKLATVHNYITINNMTVNTQYAIAVQARTGHQESPLSETVLAWTDPAIPAFLNPPVVVPQEPIVEGSNVTLLCVATGMPVPVVSLFLNGQLMVQQQQSHVALVVPHIQRNITKVDCFADNGLGTGAQSSAALEVNFMPQVESLDKRIPAEEGSQATIRCLVTGHPVPRVLWYRDRKLREPLTKNSDYDLNMKPYREKKYSYLATLTLLHVTTAHEGQYFCYAENNYGKDTVFVNVDVLPKLYTNASACCQEKKVSDECQEACNIDIDIQTALNKPNCFKDLDKLMYCAADGSDHRKCCRDNGIQRSCLRWCQGRPIINTQLCILHASKIVSCFEEGKAVLPGPPLNIQYHLTGHKDLEITWDMPQKNPKVVQWYKVFWRPIGSRLMYRNHTKDRAIALHDLEPGTTYEVVVKAGNHYGISLHSEPLTFTITGIDGDGNIITEPAGYTSPSVAKTTAAIIGTILFLLLVGGLGFFFYQRNKLMKPPPGISPGVSFENPTYMKDNIPQNNTPGSIETNGETKRDNGETKRETQT